MTNIHKNKIIHLQKQQKIFITAKDVRGKKCINPEMIIRSQKQLSFESKDKTNT